MRKNVTVTNSKYRIAMANTSARKISQIQLKTLLYRKYLDKVALTSLIVLCLMLLKSEFLKSFVVVNTPYKYPLMAPHLMNIMNVSLENELLKAIENPLTTKMKKILKCRDMPLRQEKLQYGDYWLIKNYIRGSKSINMGCGESITYTTNGDYTFIENLPTVVERWLAPVSFAIYAPGGDYNTTMESIQYARNCLPQSGLIRDYVTFHIFFHRSHLPLYVAKTEGEALDWSYDCALQGAPYTKVNRSEMYRVYKNLTYPINVARNIARKAANTYFIFACDIELYPSLGLVDQFLDMIMKNSSTILKAKKPKVFVLPIFEIEKNASLPNNKEELQQMLNQSLAITFHKFVCASCHLIPKQQQWIEANHSQDLTVFTVAKRYGKFAFWEPFYISDNKEPIFDERVTWEGQSNKRVQNYAMCLLDYEYHILHPAFLVHAPGIKRLDFKSHDYIQRQKYVTVMNKIIHEQIEPEYKVLYGKNNQCLV